MCIEKLIETHCTFSVTENSNFKKVFITKVLKYKVGLTKIIIIYSVAMYLLVMSLCPCNVITIHLMGID